MHKENNFIVAIYDNYNSIQQYFEYNSFRAALQSKLRYETLNYQVCIYTKIELELAEDILT